jgi:ABC-type Fe3+-siderophore transport system permease subunit
MAREMFTPQEKRTHQRVLLLVALCCGAFVVLLQFFSEASFSVPLALGLWVVAVGAMLYVAPKALKRAFEHYWPRR